MSGHSKWSTIKRQKGLTDAKRGAVFTKLGNQIAIAAKAGTDPTINASLAMAIEKAKAANMPNNTIDRAIARVSDKNASQLQEVMYEGYGQGGVGILVECATDNLNRTYPEVKNVFNKKGGNIAETGAVAFQFSHKGSIRVKATGDDAILTILDAGAEDAEESDGEIQVYTEAKELAKVRDAIKDAGLEVSEAELTYVPKNTIEITNTETARKVMNLMDALDELDDVVATHTNFDIAESLEV
ncbi:YebC/PmpR family DNA-binding transcriptional regulator [Candidatus Saccharibacteria bacterium]|jgi:YebC/PmpR family DNA-binding regulatory protein|nr:YebC/PmpR family DNA-binding transcriptional regulator [Candidatus Saccharibacteria bacterium]